MSLASRLGYIAGHLWMLPLTLVGLVIAGLHSALVSGASRSSWGREGVVFRYPGKLWGMENLRGQSMGGVVLLSRDASAKTLAHEWRHAQQQMVLGLFILIAYPVSSLAAALRGRHWYWDNVFEADARREAGQ